MTLSCCKVASVSTTRCLRRHERGGEATKRCSFKQRQHRSCWWTSECRWVEAHHARTLTTLACSQRSASDQRKVVAKQASKRRKRRTRNDEIRSCEPSAFSHALVAQVHDATRSCFVSSCPLACAPSSSASSPAVSLRHLHSAHSSQRSQVSAALLVRRRSMLASSLGVPSAPSCSRSCSSWTRNSTDSTGERPGLQRVEARPHRDCTIQFISGLLLMAPCSLPRRPRATWHEHRQPEEQHNGRQHSAAL